MAIPIKALEYYFQGFRLHSADHVQGNTHAQEMFKLAIGSGASDFARAYGHLAYTD